MAGTFAYLPEKGVAPLEPGAVFLSCFPSAGLAASVAAHYIVRVLRLPRIGRLESDEVPPIALVQSGEVNPAIRVHGRGKVGVVVSEFPPPLGGLVDLADSMLDTVEAQKARLLLALEGVVPHPLTEEVEEGAAKPPPPRDEQCWGIPANPNEALMGEFRRAQIRPLSDAVLAGITGALLVRGQRRSIPVAAILVSADDSEGFPDHRAAAALIESVDRLLPELAIDTKPLRSQAEMIEKAIRAAMASQRPKAARPVEEAMNIYQ
jgi:predicted ATP-grasp superfamily ATP-dependent carboligase